MRSGLYTLRNHKYNDTMNFNPQDDQTNAPGSDPQYSPQPQPGQQAPSWQNPGFQPSGWPQPAGQSGPAYDPVPGVSPSPASQTPSNLVTPPPSTHESKKWLIVAVVFILTTVVALGGGAWALINYFDQRDNVDVKVSSAVSEAVKKQADADAAAFLEKEKQPSRLFAGPDDYGSLTFEYPKTWSLHVANDASKGGTYAAYLNPVSVPPIFPAERYGLRVTVEEKDYDRVLDGFKNLVTSGDLQSTSFQLDADTTGTRLDGNFTKDIRGSAVIFKIRDKTVTLRTDAETFKADFDQLIKTIEYNK